MVGEYDLLFASSQGKPIPSFPVQIMYIIQMNLLVTFGTLEEDVVAFFL